MSISIPYITDAWCWLGQQLQSEAASMQQDQRVLDLAARQSDSFLAAAGLKTLAGLHGLGTWIVKTPGALAYGSVDFVATAVTDPVAALRAVPEAVEHSGGEMWTGGALFAAGNVSEGLTRALDGVTGDVMVILGARGAVRGTVKAAPEAGRLVQDGYRVYANAVTTGLESLRSMGQSTPNTPMNVWMRHPRRGAVMIELSSPLQQAIETARTQLQTLTPGQISELMAVPKNISPKGVVSDTPGPDLRVVLMRSDSLYNLRIFTSDHVSEGLARLLADPTNNHLHYLMQSMALLIPHCFKSNHLNVMLAPGYARQMGLVDILASATQHHDLALFGRLGAMAESGIPYQFEALYVRLAGRLGGGFQRKAIKVLESQGKKYDWGVIKDYDDAM